MIITHSRFWGTKLFFCMINKLSMKKKEKKGARNIMEIFLCYQKCRRYSFVFVKIHQILNYFAQVLFVHSVLNLHFVIRFCVHIKKVEIKYNRQLQEQLAVKMLALEDSIDIATVTPYFPSQPRYTTLLIIKPFLYQLSDLKFPVSHTYIFCAQNTDKKIFNPKFLLVLVCAKRNVNLFIQLRP